MRTVLTRPLYHVVFLAAIMISVVTLAQTAFAGGRQESDNLLQQGLAEMRAGRLTEAVPLLERAIQADPSNDRAQAGRAELYAQSNKFGDAAKKMEKAIQLRPAVAEYHSRLGEYYRKDRKPDQAIKSLEQSLKLNHNNPTALASLGQIYYEKGTLPKAETCLKEAFDLQKGSNLTDLYWLGKVRYEQGKKDGNAQKIAEGEADLEKVVSKLEASKQAPYLEATALLNEIKQDQRMATFKKVGMIGAPIVLLLLVGLVLLPRMRRSRQEAPSERMDLDIDSTSPEEISARALKRLCTMTQMAFGIMYVTNLEGDELTPSATVSLETDNLRTLQVDVHETPRWLERNDNKPFLFAAEKKEGVFVKAFPDAREQLEPLEMRIGVPFVHHDRLLGLGFVGIEKNKDILKLKKLYERSTVDIYRMAVEVAGALHRLYENEMAYVDVVTRFRSRKYVEENLPRSLVDAEDSGRKGAVILFEYDQYKALEEQYGESQAQKVVKNVAEEIKIVIPPDEGMVARFEGGRFFAFAPVHTLEQAQSFARQLHEQVCKARISRNLPSPTASVGVAVFPEHGRKADDLLWSAEQVMMGVSASGGNAVAFAEAPATATGGGGVPGRRSSSSAGGPPSVAIPPTAPAPSSSFAAPTAPLPQEGAPAGMRLMGTPPPPAPGPPSWVAPRRTGAPEASPPDAPAPGQPRVPSWIKGDSGATRSPSAVPGFTGGAPPDLAALTQNPASDSFASRSSPFKAAPGAAPAPPPAPPPPPTAPPASSGFAVPATQLRPGGGPPSPVEPPSAGEPSQAGRRLLAPPGKSGAGKLFSRRGEGSSIVVPRGAGDAFAEDESAPPPVPPAPPAPPAPGLGAPGTAPFASTSPFPGPSTSQGFPPPPPFGSPPPPPFGAPPPSPFGTPPPPPFGAPPPSPPTFGMPSAPTTPSFGLSGTTGFGAPPPPPPVGSLHSQMASTSSQRFQSPLASPSYTPPSGGTPASPGFPPPPPFGAPLGAPTARPGAPPPPPSPPPPRPNHAITANMRDPQTGFVKAEHTQRFLQEEIAWSQAATESCAVIYFRVDGYERLLSAIGPERMAQMQGTITSLIQDFLKEDSDIPGRATEEAFLLIIPRSSSRIASNLAQHICLTVSNMYVPGLDERSTISVGIAAYPEHAQNAANLTECARRASLQVHQHGGNGIQVYTPA